MKNTTHYETHLDGLSWNAGGFSSDTLEGLNALLAKAIIEANQMENQENKNYWLDKYARLNLVKVTTTYETI